MQRGALRVRQQQLQPVEPGAALHRRRHGADDLHRAVLVQQLLLELLQERERGLLLAALGAQDRQMRVGRQPLLAAFDEDRLDECLVAPVHQSRQPGMPRVEGLHQYLAGTLGALIAVLAPFRPRLAVITTFESAAIADGPGMDALTDQVRSLLAFRDAEPGVLGERLAFNVVPSVTDDDEQAEARMTAHIRAAAGAGAPLVRLSRHLVPTYSGEGASVELAVEGTPLMDAVVATLAELPSVRVGRADAPTPHDAADRDEVLVGRLRVGAGRIALWVAADRLRSTTAVPIARLIQRFGQPQIDGGHQIEPG